MAQRLMCVVAHPDDECFAFGGALALAVDRGVETYVICMTDGQAAKNRGSAASGVDLGRMRRDEFAASCKVLGVTRHELMGYRDGELTEVPIKEAAGLLVERMREFHPDVVLTFGSDGGANKHSDHMMVSMWTTAAFHWSGQAKYFAGSGDVFQPKRLYYQTTKFFIPNRQPPLPLPWTVTLDIRSVEERKFEAFRRHVSQAPLMEQTREYFRKYGAEEHYTLVATDNPQPARQSSDLFDGL
ncbi:MAG: PIG-L family deacetylase [Acidobacteria bacterium]|nr:PIG-L family deacetylase [Acidobacteriota bacterium]